MINQPFKPRTSARKADNFASPSPSFPFEKYQIRKNGIKPDKISIREFTSDWLSVKNRDDITMSIPE